jgi:hypothetical protein
MTVNLILAEVASVQYCTLKSGSVKVRNYHYTRLEVFKLCQQNLAMMSIIFLGIPVSSREWNLHLAKVGQDPRKTTVCSAISKCIIIC